MDANKRKGSRFSVFYSTDGGTSWIHPKGSLGGAVSMPMSESVLVGPAVASYDSLHPYTVFFDNVALCESPASSLPEPPTPCAGDQVRPQDWIYLLDLSTTMEGNHGAFEDGVAKRQSTARALLALHDAVVAHTEYGGTVGRVALVTYAGSSDPADNLAHGARLVSSFTDDLTVLRGELQALADSDIFTQELKTTPAALGLRKVLDLVLTEVNPFHDVAVVWATDNLPNIDDEGYGPGAYTVAELQALELTDGSGHFLSPEEVAVQGHFNTVGTFDGEVVADAMDAVLDLRAGHESLRASDQSLRIFSLVPRGDGVSSPIYSEQLLDFAAWSTGGGVFGGSSPEQLVAAVSPLLSAAFCGDAGGDPGSTTLSGKVWRDLDDDGVRDAGEPGLADIEVIVGEVMVWTNAEGHYGATVPVPPTGLVSIEVYDQDLPAGLLPTADPDGIATVHFASVAATPWAAVQDLDFGYAGGTATCVSDPFDQPTAGGGPGAAWSLKALGDADQVGAVTSAGTSSAGTLKLSGDGTTAYVGADHGAFLYQTVEGNFRLEADVLGFPVNAGGAYRKAGLMVRAGLDEMAARIMVQFVADFAGQGPALQFRARTVDGGPGDVALGSNLFGVGLPVRLAIEHVDGVYTVQYSSDGGSTWRQPAGGSGGSLSMDLGARPLAGMNTVSYDASTALTAEFDDFVVHCGVGSDGGSDVDGWTAHDRAVDPAELGALTGAGAAGARRPQSAVGTVAKGRAGS